MPHEAIFDGPTTCLSKRIWKKECLGCGMTRATYSLMHFDFKTAHEMNWRVWLVGPLLAIYWGMLFWRFGKKLRSDAGASQEVRLPPLRSDKE